MDKVKEFMLTANQPFNTFKDIIPRIRYIEEEVNELRDAIENDDLIEIIDALCDILYVVYGTSLSFGFSNDINSNSLDNVDTINTINTIDTINTLYEKRMYYFNRINNQFLTFKSLVSKPKFIYFAENVLKIITLYVYEFAKAFDIDIDKAFNIVHISNMTKFCKTLEEAEETVKEYANNVKYKEVKYIYRNGLYIVYNVEDNKVLKSKYYKKVDFRAL